MLAFLKCFSSLGAIIMLIVGLAFAGVTVYAFLNQDVFLSNQQIKHTILNGLIIVSTFVIGVAIDGIVGVCKKKCCMIAIYQFFVFIFMAIFLGIGIGTKILPNYVFDGDCRNSQNPLIPAAYKLYNNSDTYFCQESCLCSMTNTSYSKYSNDDRIQFDLNYRRNQTSGVNATQNCPEFKDKVDNTTMTFLNTVGSIQKFLQCSDWCPNSQKPNLFYRFGNVNDGKPTQTCYTALHDAFYQYSNIVGTTCFVITAIFLLVCISNICLCCHPDRKQLQFRDRFIYVTNEQQITKNGYTYKRI